ncbi:SDR family oxidoreductase [Bradyrhizobium sp. U87765 SZCCT0131]|uniref:SDR family oxidoreductase n=1 Tax=unclassified Bradyrhizobium TaxID=2631580 RepID=UPI001BAD8370|nr:MULTISPECIES: SDR family oxidoreductase [unclassified Bradyrhizobium]MBR1220680.1 SDR family oxidoreductase [Bradyrhizobium sp. U87765 SZCCT0131]MBR1262866.1 SDR family oxidoreductase [Bradyrhizobium sp. U87765 SZCCT0134]MBR1307252.1 SDR family oxidoreductase [Bradyrhizobium sp. U87765 SZCCT0110]MBR1322861.1 SDR family oxidoreductase [Bradyrhizobium sp. U87765 SZCCT0109]MBR1346206.1 SDR family oxidoreductase [Bradyrhizobium sp. U87765 SZCCT0048]
MPSDIHTPSSLEGQTIALIGGSSGLGLAIAAEARRSGADLVLVARDATRLRHAATALGGATTITADIADAEAMSALFGDIPHLDHLVITAGTARLLPLAAHSAHDLTAVLAERLVGPLLAIKAAVPRLREGGSITLTSAQLSARPIAAGAVFAAAVAGVEAMARALALELAPVRVNALAPGLIDTPLLDRILGDAKPQVLEASAASVPVRRVGRPQDVAQAALLLMTNSFITGEVLHVDGGGRWV